MLIIGKTIYVDDLMFNADFRRQFPDAFREFTLEILMKVTQNYR